MATVDEAVLAEMAQEAVRRRYKLMNEIAVEKDGTPGISLVVLVRARAAAVEAMMELVTHSAIDIEGIAALQRDVARYADMVRWTQEAIDQGLQAEEEMTRDDLEAVRKDIHGWRTEEYDDSDAEY